MRRAFSTQKSFKEEVVNLVHTINEFGNPFLENSSEYWYWTHGML